jgi:hypothetical protein
MRTQASRCENTFAFGCFDFGVRPGTWQGSAPTVQPPPKSPQTLAAAKFLSNNTVQLHCLKRAPGRRVTEKANFSTLIVGLARPQTRATCVAHSGANCSAIHYNSCGAFREWKKMCLCPPRPPSAHFSTD